jgi:hypothetical protein
VKTKADYKRAIEIVGAVVRDLDPYALLATGCPADEFDSEIASIVTQIPRIRSENDAAHALSRVFSSAFGDQFSPDAYKPAAIKLFAALSENGLID